MRMRIISISFAAAVLLAGCAKEPEVNPNPDTPDTPTAGYRFTFDGSAGDNNVTRAGWTDNNDDKLTFAWDYTDVQNPEYEMVMAFRRSPEEEDLLETLDGSDYTEVVIKHHSKDNGHWAVFETVKEYEQPMPNSNYDGYTVYALHGKAIELIDGSFSDVQMPMPNEFTQTADTHDANDGAFKPTAHLKDYMYMYARSEINNGTTTLGFRHLTVPVRFRVYNWRTEASKIYSVTMEEAEGRAISRSRIDFCVEYYHRDLKAEYPQDQTHSSVIVKGMKNGEEGFSINPKEQDGDEVMFYAHLLPFGDEEDALAGKTLLFTLEVDDPSGEGRKEYLTYELPAETFYKATQSYNWQAGDLYTFHLYLDDVLTVGKVTVNDWYEGGTIVDGEAVEWVNGINTETGEYEPARMNWDDYYEIKNAGNLFWFAQQVNDSSDPDNSELCAVLMADIDLENRPWTPIGNEVMPYNGHFNGNGHTITGFNQNQDVTGEWSLFGSVGESAVIENYTINGSSDSNSTEGDA